jgi:hypothetical protein
MARTFHSGELVPSWRFEAESDARGFWTGWQEFSAPKGHAGELLPEKGSVWNYFTFMTVVKRKIIGMEGELVRVMVFYEGANTSGGEGGEGGVEAVYSLRVALSEEPISTHPRYVDALTAADIMEAYELATNPPREKEGTGIKVVDTAEWDPLKIELYEDLQKGIEAYRDPKVTWTKRWVDEALPTNLNEIGDISTPEGDPPAVANDRNWIFGGLTSDQRGEVYELEATWELSGRGGWLERYYGE